ITGAFITRTMWVRRCVRISVCRARGLVHGKTHRLHRAESRRRQLLQRLEPKRSMAQAQRTYRAAGSLLLSELYHSGTVRRVFCGDGLAVETFTCGLVRTNLSLQPHAALLEVVKKTP